MKVTVCELNDSAEGFARDWERLAAHVKEHRSDLVLLPEMTFCPWFAWRPDFEMSIWQDAVAAHDRWQERLTELNPAIVLGTRPVNRADQRLNEGFRWMRADGYQVAHHKYYLPNEPGFWEPTGTVEAMAASLERNVAKPWSDLRFALTSGRLNGRELTAKQACI